MPVLFKIITRMTQSLSNYLGDYSYGFQGSSELSAPSPGDDLRSKSAIRLRGQIVRSDSFWEIGCDFAAVTIRLRLRCILR